MNGAGVAIAFLFLVPMYVWAVSTFLPLAANAASVSSVSSATTIGDPVAGPGSGVPPMMVLELCAGARKKSEKSELSPKTFFIS